MMTREEVAEVMTYCKEKGISYKIRLSELGIPAWLFYGSKARYAQEQEAAVAKGEFLQLSAGGSFVPAPSFAATSGKKTKAKKEDSASRQVSIELRTSNGTMMRIQGEMSPSFIQGIIQASNGHV
jgi:hypothetical protein